MEVSGDLLTLRARGGRAAALADAIEAVVAMTDGVREPCLRLILGIGYRDDIARSLAADILVRTGMEEPGVLRLSGIEAHERAVAYATTTLWPHIEPTEVDEIIVRCKQHMAPELAPGHDIPLIVDLATSLSGAPMMVAAEVMVTTTASAAMLAEAFDAVPANALPEVSIELEGGLIPLLPRRTSSPHKLRIVKHGVRTDRRAVSVLAPGQAPPLFTLPDWLALGSANVFSCGTTAADLIEIIREAQRFSITHPALLGGDRPIGRGAAHHDEYAPLHVDAGDDWDQLGDRFAAKMLRWAEGEGLLLSDRASRTAAMGYALTAFIIHFRVPAEWDVSEEAWERRAELTAKYMLIVAAGDEAIFDRVVDGEAPQRRLERLDASARLLLGALRDGQARPAQLVHEKILVAIAEQWRSLLDEHRGASVEVVKGFYAALEELYTASVTEHRPSLRSDLPFEPGLTSEAMGAPTSSLFEGPEAIARHARALMDNGSDEEAQRELRALTYLSRVSGSIGAGLLFRASALAAPALAVPKDGLAALDEAARLIDYHVRLSNDMSGFLTSRGGDRDAKENACTILVPRSMSGATRERGVICAHATCRRLLAWLDGEVRGHVARVAEVWPWMGVILQRGTFVGRRVYEMGHYTTLPRRAMSAIFNELEGCRA